jgi:hypothetical protein
MPEAKQNGWVIRHQPRGDHEDDDGCGGLPVRAELLTSIEGASGRPVRRIVLVGG